MRAIPSDPATRVKIIVAFLVVALACLWGLGRSETAPATNERNPSSTAAYDDAAAAINRGDFTAAMRLSRPFAEQGNIWAQEMLGLIYFEGYGVAHDYAEAMRWFRRAADQGKVSAQQWIGTMYRDGNGVPRDYVRAYMWFAISMQNNERTDSETEIGSAAQAALSQFMTVGQIAEARLLAKEWKPGGPDLQPAQTRNPSNPSASSSAEAHGTNQALRIYAGLIDRVVIGGLSQSRGIVNRGCGVLGSSSDQMMCTQGLRIAETQIHNAQKFISNPSIQIPDCVSNIHERLREGLERVAQGYTAAQSGMSARDMGSYHAGMQDVEAGESLVIEANSDLKAKSASGLCLPR